MHGLPRRPVFHKHAVLLDVQRRPVRSCRRCGMLLLRSWLILNSGCWKLHNVWGRDVLGWWGQLLRWLHCREVVPRWVHFCCCVQ